MQMPTRQLELPFNAPLQRPRQRVLPSAPGAPRPPPGVTRPPLGQPAGPPPGITPSPVAWRARAAALPPASILLRPASSAAP